MRKLVVQEWLSVDGFAADENASTDWFGPTEEHKQSDEDILESMERFDTIILGANTYKMFLDFWPTDKADGEIIAPRLNATPKLVFSNSLQKTEWGKWDNAHLQKGDAVQIITDLKQQPGKDLILWGSLSLFRSLLNAGLVDEIEIRTVPIILGKGYKLFGESDQVKLQSGETKKYDSSGNTLVHYTVK